jgi:hypothetical protein
MVFQVEVLDAQAQTLGEAQSAPVEEPGDQLVVAGEEVDDALDLVAGEDGGQVLRAGGASQAVFEGKVLLEHLAVEKEQGAEGLVLGGGGNMLHGGEVDEKAADLIRPHVGGVALVVEEDVALDPVNVGLFGVLGVVFDAQLIADLVEEFPAGRGWNRFFVHKPPCFRSVFLV